MRVLQKNTCTFRSLTHPEPITLARLTMEPARYRCFREKTTLRHKGHLRQYRWQRLHVIEFTIENALTFEDFPASESQLREILDFKLNDQDLGATDLAKQVVGDLLDGAKNRPNFGNAGEVAKIRYQNGLASVPPDQRSEVIFEPQDFDPDWGRDRNAPANVAKLFEDLVGCDDIVRKLSDYQKIARTMKASGVDMRKQIPTSVIFKGPPGTAKTREFGQVYYDMGFLSSPDLVECSASNLLGQYVGHTGPKTKKLFEKALGKVLFVFLHDLEDIHVLLGQQKPEWLRTEKKNKAYSI
ncbi:hypothetical protein BS47DRAFT_1433670 [Hydnum rufescens UP504]|uniref:ATPase AAA-type core domain-containing protein n=1 Tax=Hydnum rufescens UP504 TaxID=1448309 RepID=A0A9P6B6V6_9AGAM|nr:hypothetical protein BS47DRAFT_1433670 [Hydnum rufescens UP504]